MSLNTNEDLSKLSENLQIISKEYASLLSDIDEKKKFFEENKILMEKLLNENQDKIITIQFGSKKAQTYLKNILVEESFFYYEAINNYKINSEVREYYYFDRSSDHMDTILNYFRTKKFYLKGYSYKELSELKNEVFYFGLWDIYRQIALTLSEIKLIGYKASPLHNSCKSPDARILHILGNNGGISVNTPYYITFEIELDVVIRSIDIHGFTLNPSLFAPTNGTNCKISISYDNIIFEEVGCIPSGFGNNIVKVEFKIQKKAKYIKFQHTGNLGIGYLKINVA